MATKTPDDTPPSTASPDPSSPEYAEMVRKFRTATGFSPEPLPGEDSDWRRPEDVPAEELATVRAKALEFYEQEQNAPLPSPSIQQAVTAMLPPVPQVPAPPVVPDVPAPSLPSAAAFVGVGAVAALSKAPAAVKMAAGLIQSLPKVLHSTPPTPAAPTIPSVPLPPAPSAQAPAAFADPAEPVLRSRPTPQPTPPISFAAVSGLLGTPEFEFEASGHSAGHLAVSEFSITEELSRPYTAVVMLVAREGVETETSQLLGQEAALSIHLDPETTRYVHGVITRLEKWGSGAGPDRRRYVAHLSPRLQTLGLRAQCRIFQDLSVPEIVQEVLSEGGVALRLALSSDYPRRDYCVQYRETDFDFVSRLLEEEGIFYSFEHEQDGHTVVLRDSAAACPDLDGDPQILFREESGMATEEHVFAFREHREVRPNLVTLRDFQFLQPGLDLTSSAKAGSLTALAGALEIYDYPGRYGEPGTGRRYSQTRLEELQVEAETGAGSSTSRRLSPGQVFELADHPLEELNGDYLILSVKHRGWQPEALHSHHGLVATERRRYENEFVCLRAGVAFRPQCKTPRPIISGSQTAIVVGPPSEEIFTDEHGRIKVQFHWDREGNRDDRSSCWIRVSQAWAGPGWGALYLPRIGHEVVIEFLEGDPDRPMVTGSAYNGTNPPPIKLPHDKTQSTLRSASSPGGAGSNELRFEDAAGSEEVYLHAQKDLDIVVENDKTQHVGGNESLRVDKDRSRSVGGNQSLLVEKNDASTIHQNQSLEVALDRTTIVGGSHSETIGGDQSVHVGATSSITVGLAAMETVGAAKALTVGAAYAVTVGGAMNELVGGLKCEEVGGAKTEVVGGRKTERVAGSRTLQVGGDVSETVGGSRSLRVEKDLTLNVGGTLKHVARQEYRLDAPSIELSADNEFQLSVGPAKIQVTKSGEVTITGVQVDLNASGPLTLKGSTVSEN